MKRILVTGASGFVGGHLVPLLHEKGFEIWAGSHWRLKKFSFPVHWIRTDLTDFKETLELVSKSRPHYVFHLAAQTVPGKSWKDPGQTLRLNVEGSIFLLEGILRFAPRARVVFVSSAQVYGATFFTKERVREEDVANPLTPYAASKLLGEMAALNYVTRHGLSVVIARAFNQMGTGQKETDVFSDFCRQIALMEKKMKPPLLKVGNVKVIRDFIHVRDSVRAYHLLAQRGKSGEVYNIGSGEGMRLTEALDFLAKESRVPFKIQVLASRLRRNDFSRAIVDPSKLRRLGWRPQESIWQGLRELLQEWREKIGYNKPS